MTDELEKAILDCLAETRVEMGEEDLAEFIHTLPGEVAAKYHFGLGLYLRNHVLMPGGLIHDLFFSGGVTHKDDMSSQMMALWHRELNDTKE